MMSLSREENGIKPPSFLPLAHSHNIVLDDEIDKERKRSVSDMEAPHQEEEVFNSISASQEDLLNGNILEESPKKQSTTPGDRDVDSLLETDVESGSEIPKLKEDVGSVNFNQDEIIPTLSTGTNMEEATSPNKVFSLISQEFVESFLNNNEDEIKEKESMSNLTTIQPLACDADNESELVWESEFTEHDNRSDISKRGSSPHGNRSHSSLISSETVSHSGWRKLVDVDGNYYWNVETGATQYEVPYELENVTDESDADALHYDSVDSTLADLEGAAFRYASLHIGSDDFSDRETSNEWTISSDSGRMFSVRSLGWLPMEECSSDPDTSSSDVNACIRHLSCSHGQIMDGIGAWGDGKDLLLLIEDEYLKLVDPLTQAVLQSQVIKHIRVWGVGRDNPHDFAYVSRDNVTRKFKCHVFRCDASAKAIARELHNVCEKLPSKHKNSENEFVEKAAEKEKLAMSTTMPAPKAEPSTIFEVKYLGSKKVESVNGITTIKNVIRDITTDDVALCENSTASVSASALIITGNSDERILVNCRMRCLSFMGIGDDISHFAFISVVAGEGHCHVLQCQPNAVKLALALQEACMLRFQKAVDSKSFPESLAQPSTPRKSVREFVRGIFSRKKTT